MSQANQRRIGGRPGGVGVPLLTLVVGLGLACPRARGEVSNFDVSAKIYTKFLYQNNDSQGVLTLGNPHPDGDNYSGSNGIGTEAELGIVGRVSPRVSGGMRIKSRFGSVWQDWWENGNMTDKAPLTGETLGMDHAQYMKLRGTWIRVGTGSEALRWIHVGSSDLGMFNPWTIGKVRYIDRDNANGIFGKGSVGSLSYDMGIIALPKLFVGPIWSTGLGDDRVPQPFITRDFAYAAKAAWDVTDDWTLTSVVSFTDDLEVDLEDPDASGSPLANCQDELGNPVPGCEHDHEVSLTPRYRNLVATVEAKGMVGDYVTPQAFVAYSMSRLDEDLVTNAAEGDGFTPIVYKDTGSDGLADMAIRARVEVEDLVDGRLNLKLEYFNIGEDFNTIFGARREADVLLTDGIVASDQLPTLNLANEFMDFDEQWVESCIGWHGATALASLDFGSLTLRVEGTGIDYNTDMQGRDVDHVYPRFMYNQGHTDTELYDYSNRLDRGADPRAVYRRDQQRFTGIGVAWLDYALPFGPGWSLGLKAKVVLDRDERDTSRGDDDYDGTILSGALRLTMPVTRWLTLTPGLEIDRWDEANRSGTPAEGYEDYETSRDIASLAARVEYQGVTFTYRLEYIHKEQVREFQEDQLWEVVRSKGTAEVAW